MTVTIPALRTIVTPVEGDTRADRVEAMRVLSAGNTIIVVILAGVLLLQVRLTFTWVGPFFRLLFFFFNSRRQEKNTPGESRQGRWRK
jgi:hypothetical protein